MGVIILFFPSLSLPVSKPYPFPGNTRIKEQLKSQLWHWHGWLKYSFLQSASQAVAALLLNKPYIGTLFSYAIALSGFPVFNSCSQRKQPFLLTCLCVLRHIFVLFTVKPSVRHQSPFWVSLPLLLPEVATLKLDEWTYGKVSCSRA